ncbi:MAG: serine/threonine-protein kinase [Byssovorax sp.]
MSQPSPPFSTLAPLPPNAAVETHLPQDGLSSTPYRILGELGRGGMGTIFEAEHVALQKRVVVKLLHPQLAREPRIVERLRREARSLARLSSPFVVAVSDMGQTADGGTYLVMERLIGRTLRQELRERGALPLHEAIGWTRQVLAGLGAAHRIGIVHRDIKLDNLFLCDATDEEPRRLKLLDFGIAKVLEHPGKQPEPAGSQQTEEGTILGSPRWLAPEQARGQTVDTRADIYAVGVLLYTLVVGRGPFAHLVDPFDAIQAHISEEPMPPSLSARQHIPPEVDGAILRALAKLPGDRFQTAQAFSEALAVLAQRPGEDTPPLLGSAHQGLIKRCQDVLADVDLTAPTVVDRQALDAAAPGRESVVPTLVRRPVGLPPGAGSTAATGGGGRRAALFAALVTASTVIFFVLLASIAHMFGGR